jgi:hypothetical protein
MQFCRHDKYALNGLRQSLDNHVTIALHVSHVTIALQVSHVNLVIVHIARFEKASECKMAQSFRDAVYHLRTST